MFLFFRVNCPFKHCYRSRYGVCINHAMTTAQSHRECNCDVLLIALLMFWQVVNEAGQVHGHLPSFVLHVSND